MQSMTTTISAFKVLQKYREFRILVDLYRNAIDNKRIEIADQVYQQRIIVRLKTFLGFNLKQFDKVKWVAIYLKKGYDGSFASFPSLAYDEKLRFIDGILEASSDFDFTHKSEIQVNVAEWAEFLRALNKLKEWNEKRLLHTDQKDQNKDDNF